MVINGTVGSSVQAALLIDVDNFVELINTAHCSVATRY